MRNEAQQPEEGAEKELAKSIQEKAFKGGQNAVTTYETNLQAPEAPKVELPKGGGALRSIGEKFEANPVTGTANISVPVAMSPGRNGFQPQLSLSYSSGASNGFFGMGWNIGLASISRKTQKGLPLYDDATESDVFLLAGIEDLVPMTDTDATYENDGETHIIQRYQPRIEGSFLKIEQWTDKTTGEIHWRVTDKGNVVSVFGESDSTRIYDSENSARVFEWKIDRRYDPLGNIIQFEYKRENTDNIGSDPAEVNRLANNNSFHQLYPKTIKYGNSEMYGSANWANNSWHFELVFDYGEHTGDPVAYAPTQDWLKRQDSFSTFRSGFDIRTHRLCRRVLMYHRFSGLNGGNPLLVKSTELLYNENPIGTQLQAVTHKAYDEQDSKQYPSVSFVYTQAEINQNVQTLSVEDSKNLPNGVDGQSYSWADPKGEGIQGILTESANAWYFKANEGHDNFYEDHPSSYVPEPKVSLGKLHTLHQKPNGATAASLQDIDGDGKPEAVVRDQHMMGYYKQNQEGEWSHFEYFDGHPNLDFQSEDVKMVDLNGDGRADILITDTDSIEWIPYEDNDPSARKEDRKLKAGYGFRRKMFKALEEEQGPRVVFSNGKQNIFLSDMTGDGFSDLVRIENGSIDYWPHKGFGLFGNKVSLSNVPLFDSADQFDASRIRLGDIDGSGTTDVLYLGASTTSYFINQAGNSLAAEVELTQFPTKDNLQNVQLVDILGNGTSCLVWSSPHEKDKPLHIKYIDLMGGEKPYLLKEMDNGMGALRKFAYAPSTKFYLRDQREGNPWITKLPFPVQTLERVEVFEQITQSRFVSRYAYHHGYFDPVEREFRGFGMVEQWDTELYEDFAEDALFQVGSNALDEESHSQPVYTKSWFHNGYYEQTKKIEEQYAQEYWDGDSQAFTLEANEFSGNYTAGEYREAHRALKGSLLRQEVYGIDEQGEISNPYVVSENRYKLIKIQDIGENRFAVFRSELQESFSYQYEQDATDPRISQQLLLDSDRYGNPLKTATVAYPRRGSGHEAEQLQEHIIYRENTFINVDPLPVGGKLTDAHYRIGSGSEEEVWEYSPQNFTSPLTAAVLEDGLSGATELDVEVDFSGTQNEKRLITKAKISYYSQDLSAELSQGSIAAHGLVYRMQQLALTNGLIDEVYNEIGTTRIDPTTTPGQTTLTEAGYLQNGNEWWVPSSRMTFDSTAFYVPQTDIDVFGNTTTLGYDVYHFLPVQITDAVGNIVQAENDYVHLQPTLVTDPNGNRQQVVMDALGMPVKMLVMGKAATHPDYVADEGDTLAAPSQLYEYDLFQFQNNLQPNFSKVTQRETHINDANNADKTRTDISYYDGLGKAIQQRSQFGDYSGTNGTDTQVAVSGRQVVNNKDLVIEQYEPYFDKGFEYNSRTTIKVIGEMTLESFAQHAENFFQLHGTYGFGQGNLLRDYMNTNTGYSLPDNISWLNLLVEHELYFILPELNSGRFIDYGDHPQYHIGSNDLSIEAWVYPESASGTMSILANQNYENSRFYGINTGLIDSKPFFTLADGAGAAQNLSYAYMQTDVAIPINTWTYLTFIRTGNDPQDWKVYINGVNAPATYVNILQSGDLQNLPFETLKLGSRQGSYHPNHFNGYIASARMYDRLMDESEVLSNYESGLSGEPSDDSNLLFYGVLSEKDENEEYVDKSSHVEKGVGLNPAPNYIFNTEWRKLEAIQQAVSTSRIKLTYDALGRNIRVDYADGTFEKVEFDAWQQKNYDRNDTVLDSQWYVDRNSPIPVGSEPTDVKERAAWLSAQHYDTPQLLELDTLGRMFLQKEDLGGSTLDSRFAYDIQSRMRKVTDPRGLITKSNYPLLSPGKDEEQAPLFTDSPDAGKRHILNDAAQKPIKRWNARGHVYHHHYDNLQRPIELWVSPPGSADFLAEVYTYGEIFGAANNLKGQLFMNKDQSGKLGISHYDFKGNPINRSQKFANDFQGDLDYNAGVSLQTESFNSSLTMDALGRPVTETTPDGSIKSYAYHPSGLLKQVQVDVRAGGTNEDAITDIHYNARGQRTEVFYANGSKTTSSYDSKTFRLERIFSTRNSGADVLQDLNYTFDAVGNIVLMKDDAQQTFYFSNQQVLPESKYEYDALYRLTKATGRQLIGLNGAPNPTDITLKNPIPDSDTTALENYTRTYQYDANGNMTQMKNVAGNSWTKDFYYETTSNCLDRHSDPGSSEYNYDANGNLLDGVSVLGLTYNENDQITKADLGGGGTAYYRYDSSGNRVRKVIVNGSSEKERLYLGSTEVYRESTSGILQLERETLYCSDDRKQFLQLDTLTVNAGDPVASPTTEWRYQFDNHLSSASLELDDTAAVISYEEYFPFGATSYHSGRSDAEVKRRRFRYTGKERDEETGLYYYGARYYAPWLARFTSADPLGMVDGPSLYAYVRNNPIKLNDPDGQQAGGDEENGSEVYKASDFDQIELGKYERGSRGIKVGNEGAQFNMVGLYDESGNAIAWLAQRIVPEGEYKGLYNGTGEGLQDAYIVPLDSFAHFRKNAGDYYDKSRAAEVYDVLWGEIERSPVKSFIMGGGLSAGVGVSGLFRSLSNLPAKMRSSVAGLKNIINSAGKITNLKKFLSLRSAQNTIKKLPTQIHHFATNKHSVFTKQMDDIAKKFGLGLDEDWNKMALPHQGRHPNEYHNFVLSGMKRAASESKGNKTEFLNLFDQYVKQPVINNPQLLRKKGWE